MRIAICDDEQIYIDEILLKCKSFMPERKITYNCFFSGEELLKSDILFDFLFLDIEMTGVDGIQVKEILEKQNSQVKIVFLTGHNERMMEAFGYNVIGFLTKPVQDDKLRTIIDKMKSHSDRRLVEWEEDGKYFSFYAEDISYIEAQDKYTVVVVDKEKYLVRRTLKTWEGLLPVEIFCKVNRSCLMNLKLFHKFKNEITLTDGKVIRISRKDKNLIEEKYKAYIRRKIGDM